MEPRPRAGDSDHGSPDVWTRRLGATGAVQLKAREEILFGYDGRRFSSFLSNTTRFRLAKYLFAVMFQAVHACGDRAAKSIRVYSAIFSSPTCVTQLT